MILITGATGFMGQHLTSRLLNDGRAFAGSGRRMARGGGDPRRIADQDLMAALGSRRFETVVHLAGRAHVLSETSADPLSEFRAVNRDLALRMAEAAARAGARRFVYLSSIGVLGHKTTGDDAFTARSAPAPHNAYARSKLEAEQGLADIAARTGMAVTILRPPLVYGSGAPGNFASLVSWLRRGVPLPLGAVHNRRSLVGIGNLVDLILTCIDHPAAANRTFLVSDDEDLSTSELLRRTARAMGVPARLIPVPAPMLTAAARLLGKGEMAERLLGSLRVDVGETRAVLDWTPPFTVDEGLRAAVAAR